jgi:hypothetical protein
VPFSGASQLLAGGLTLGIIGLALLAIAVLNTRRGPAD